MPQQYIDFAFVKQNASFERVIAGYNLQLIGKGTERSLLCPFHKERKASCKLDLQRNIFNCFGCGAKGNILEFVARLEGAPDDLRSASLKIAELCGIATAPPREGQREKQTSGQQPKTAAKPRAKDGSHKSDRNAPAPARRGTGGKNADRPAGGRDYSPDGHRSGGEGNSNSARLTDRQLHGEAEPVNPPLSFELKLDPAHPYLKEHGLSAELITEFGLGYCGRGSMAGRICFPIHNERGELVAYAGRWPGEPPEDVERYLLPAKFEKRGVLYNLNRVGDTEHIVLVEGYWSAIRLHALGVPVAALMGWFVSAEHIALLRERGVRFVTLLLDGDDTGRRGRERALPELAAEFFVSAPLLPDGEKPDTLDEELLLELVAPPSK